MFWEENRFVANIALLDTTKVDAWTTLTLNAGFQVQHINIYLKVPEKQKSVARANLMARMKRYCHVSQQLSRAEVGLYRDFPTGRQSLSGMFDFVESLQSHHIKFWGAMMEDLISAVVEYMGKQIQEDSS